MNFFKLNLAPTHHRIIRKCTNAGLFLGYPASPPSPGSAPPSPEPMMDTDLSASGGVAASAPAASSSAQGSKVEKPIFTLKQMTLIAERMCKVQ